MSPVAQNAADLIPPKPSLRSLEEAAAGCRACPLWKSGTQTVFGAGPRRPRLMLVGEQPGDEEDRAGLPFVGPAGRLLDTMLEEVGIARDDAYVTNVVKHFKWVPRGKRRLHQKPNAREIGACLPWLEAEIELLKPKALVLLGATAAQAILGRSFRVSAQRGKFVKSELAPIVMATFHPSSVLRARDDREAARRALVADMAKLAAALR
jgi:DNA polymerase